MAQTLQTAIELHRTGRLAEAEPIYRQLVQADPRNAQALHFLGMLLLQTGRAPESLPLLRSAAKLAPQVAQMHLFLAQAARVCGQFAEAQAAAWQAIALRPDLAPAHNELGLALVNQGLIDQAIAAWKRAVQVKPDYVEAYSNLGGSLAQTGRLAEAIDALRKAVALQPDHAASQNNLAGALNEAGHVDEAMQYWRRAIELKPDFFDALQNLAKTTHQAGNDAEALAMADRAIAIRPDDPQVRFIRSLINLADGRLREGFTEYEFRKRSTHFDVKGRDFPQPAWTGGDVAGRRILLHAEQGLGDTIQFVRYATMLAERGATVILESPAELAELLRTVLGVSAVVPRGSALPAFDMHASVVSMPALCGTTLETIPAKVPYLTPDPARVAKWKQLLGQSDRRRRVGLVWAGNPSHTNDRQRSIPSEALAPLAAVENVEWFSLQKGRGLLQVNGEQRRVDAAAKRGCALTDAALPMVDHTALLTDFAETAALVSLLDLVITVDTSVAHFAGALGKPVWTLVAYVADWRWMKQRTDSPWYPTMRLFRQPAMADWASVIGVVCAELDETH